jgi:tetratricopeptide (TPR) repeat protein
VHREALALWRKRAGNEDQETLHTLHRLGLTFEREGKWAEAEAVHRERLAVWRQRGENESPQALSELERFTHVLMAQKKFGDAEQLLDEALTPAFARQPPSANLLALKADLKARRGQWQEAAADAALALEHQPFNPRYAMVAALFIKSHNRPAYEQLCKRLLTMFANTTDIYVADQVAKSCLFLPPSDVDLKLVGFLADLAVTRGTGDQDAMPFYQDCKALSEYRRGHYAEAVEWAEKPLKIPGIYVHGHAYAVLAMAYWRLGEKDEARAMLAKGDTLAPPIIPLSIAEDPGNAWLAWLYARIQLDEATALIKPGSTTDNNSNPP